MAKETEIKVKYYTKDYKTNEKIYSHSYIYKWGLLDKMYCPVCGDLGCVWKALNPGDEYLGELHICSNCDRSFYFPDWVQSIDQDTPDSWQILQQIKDNG